MTRDRYGEPANRDDELCEPESTHDVAHAWLNQIRQQLADTQPRQDLAPSPCQPPNPTPGDESEKP